MNAVVSENVAWLDRSSVDAVSRATIAFQERRDPREMYAAAGQRRALEGLLRLASEGNAGCGLLTAAPGLGKTLIRAALHQQAPAERCAVVATETGLLDFDDLLLEILSQLRGERLTAEHLPGRYERIAELKSALVSEVVSEGRHLVVLLDDADQLSVPTLNAVAALMNLCSDREAFIVPVLFGQPSLRQALSSIPALRQRVGAQFTLAPLSAAECSAYVEHRLQAAGFASQCVFDAGMTSSLHRASGGIPRVVNALCRQALRHASELGLAVAGATSLDAARSLLLDAGAARSPVFVGQPAGSDRP
jgi:type II secretory pathway predicted ATPase ExeA